MDPRRLNDDGRDPFEDSVLGGWISDGRATAEGSATADAGATPVAGVAVSAATDEVRPAITGAAPDACVIAELCRATQPLKQTAQPARTAAHRALGFLLVTAAGTRDASQSLTERDLLSRSNLRPKDNACHWRRDRPGGRLGVSPSFRAWVDPRC